jgi:hypothetical protein
MKTSQLLFCLNGCIKCCFYGDSMTLDLAEIMTLLIEDSFDITHVGEDILGALHSDFSFIKLSLNVALKMHSEYFSLI